MDPKFAVIIYKSRIWGALLAPVILKYNDSLHNYAIDERITASNCPTNLSDVENEVVSISDSYCENSLFKLFAKKMTKKKFKDTLDPEKFKTIIRPHIESRISKLLLLAKTNKMPIYYGDNLRDSVRDEDELSFSDVNANALFCFNRGEEEITYKLMLFHKDKEVNLKTHRTVSITNSPVVVLVMDTIYFVDDIEGAKILPFITKENVLVPKSYEKKYFNTFVLNAVQNYKVKGTGFSIKEEKIKPSIKLHLDKDMVVDPVFELYFEYNNKKINIDSKLPCVTTFDFDTFTYTKISRDAAIEKETVEKLKSIGLVSKDNFIFTIDESSADNKSIHDYVAWLSEKKSYFDENNIETVFFLAE